MMDHAGSTHSKPTLLIALGGNALIRKGQKGSVSEQFENLRIPIRQIASLIDEYNIILWDHNVAV